MIGIALLLLCVAVTMMQSRSVTYLGGKELATVDLEGMELRSCKSSKNYFNLPPFLYNMCALYYVMPDCLEELFGEDFDIASLIAEVCPSS